MSGFPLRALICAALLALAAPAQAQDNVTHLGVQSCAGNNCHGAVRPLPNSHVPQDEYLIWSQKDKHAQAYVALTTDRSKRASPRSRSRRRRTRAALPRMPRRQCVARAQGAQFRLADGVGCETCHGGADSWLGIHLSGAGRKPISPRGCT